MCPLMLSRFVLPANAGGDVYCIYLTPSKVSSRPTSKQQDLSYEAAMLDSS